jgi:uncharacterized coiled-coil protein SlyX
MTDKLIKRLRDVRLEGVEELCWKAADHIEDLNGLLTSASDDAEKAEAHVKVLEDKLQAALDMLQSFVDQAQHARFAMRELEDEE